MRRGWLAALVWSWWVAGLWAQQAPPGSATAWRGEFTLREETAQGELHLTGPTGEELLFDLTRTGWRLSAGTAPKRQLLAEGQLALAPGTHTWIVQAMADQFIVVIDQQELYRGRHHDGDGWQLVARQSEQAPRPLPEPNRQKLGPIAFADDFARLGRDQLQWDVASGEFAIAAAQDPDSAQGAFVFEARGAEEEAFALAQGSYWFWDDYLAGVSFLAPPAPASFALVAHAAGPRDAVLLRWTQPAGAAGTLQLVVRSRGREEVVTERPATWRAGQWYRLALATHGPELVAWCGGREIARNQVRHLGPGRVGLAVTGAGRVRIDDVTVRSVTAAELSAGAPCPEPFGPGEQRWVDFSKKSFYDDPHMVEWAHPRTQWQGAAPDAALKWFRPTLFHEARLTWQRQPGDGSDGGRPLRLVLCGDPARPDSGYRFTLAQGVAVLAREGGEVARQPLPAAPIARLAASAAGGLVRLTVNDQPLFAWTDPAPLAHGQVAGDLGPDRGAAWHTPDWRDQARVESSHRLDYSFEHAPTAWQVQSGEWRPTHRWACVPRWSFFSGRGHRGIPGEPFGNVLLWNGRRVAGDCDLELFLAPLEGTAQRLHFAYPVTMGIAFAADGSRLDSGYFLHFGLYDQPTVLYRRGVALATWNGRHDPSLRPRDMPWYHRITQVWQHIRIQRQGPRLLIDFARHDDKGRYLGLERAFDLVDPEPLTGERFGIWAHDANGLAIARATLSYADSPGVAPPPEPPPGERRGDLILTPGPDGDTRATNLDSGGAFAHELLAAPLPLTPAHGRLRLRWRAAPEAALALFAQVRGHAVEIGLAAPPPYRPWTIPLGALAVTANDDWQTGELDLHAALREHFPDGPLEVERLVLGSPGATPAERFGFGANPPGAWVETAPLAWLPGAAVAPPPPRPRLLVQGLDPMADFEESLDGWTNFAGPDGALLWRDPQLPFAGRRSLRLQNQRIGGPAGASFGFPTFLVDDFPRLSLALRLAAGSETNLVVEANDRFYEVQVTGVESSFPSLGPLPGVRPDGAWHAATFDLAAALRRVIPRGPIRVQSLAWADSARMTSYQRQSFWCDEVALHLALHASAPTPALLRLGDQPAAAHVAVFDTKPTTEPPTEPAQPGDTLALVLPPGATWLHVRARAADGTWSATRHYPVVPRATPPAPVAAPAAPTGPPPSPYIAFHPSDALVCTTAEWGTAPAHPERLFDQFAIRRSAWWRAIATDAATGSGALELVNLDASEFNSGYLHQGAWDPARYPRVAFDYRFANPGVALNLSLLVNDTMTIVEWTGRNGPGGYFGKASVGAAPLAVQDNQWHHADFDLLAMLRQTRYPGELPPLVATELATWATNHRLPGFHNATGSRVRVDNFTLYSPRGRHPAFTWRVHAPHDLAGYATAFDQVADTVPATTVTTTATRAEYRDVAPGTWYFHVRAVDIQGRWSDTSHHPLTIEP